MCHPQSSTVMCPHTDPYAMPGRIQLYSHYSCTTVMYLGCCSQSWALRSLAWTICVYARLGIPRNAPIPSMSSLGLRSTVCWLPLRRHFWACDVLEPCWCPSHETSLKTKARKHGQLFLSCTITHFFLIASNATNTPLG